MQPRDDISDRPRSPSPYYRQIEGLEKRIQPEETNLRRDSTTSATLTLANEVTSAAHVPPAYQYSTNDKGQKPTSYQSWAGHGKTTGSTTPPEFTSPSPSGNLNSQQTRRPDAAMCEASPRERPKFVHFRENSERSYEQDALKKTHQ